MEKLTVDSLEKIHQSFNKVENEYIKVGMSTCGIAAGANEVFDVFKQQIEEKNLSINLHKCGCIGMCFAEPLVEIKTKGLTKVLYGKVDKDVALTIINEHIEKGQLINDHIYDNNV